MATARKKTAGATPKKRSPRSTSTKSKRTTKKSTIKAVKETPAQDTGLQETLPVIPEAPAAPNVSVSPQMPNKVIVDGEAIPIRGIASPQNQQAAISPPANTPPPTNQTPQSQFTISDERERARIARLERRQRERELRNGLHSSTDQVVEENKPMPAVNQPAVAPVPSSPPSPPLEQVAAPPAPLGVPADLNSQQLAQQALQAIAPKQAAQPPTLAQNPDLRLPIPELFQYKIQVYENRMREISAPINEKLKEDAERMFREASATALRENAEYQEACRQVEACVNELLEQLQPQMPEGYAVVVVGAKEGAAICRYAPNQAGKRFKID
jgi:hypothetical protein